MSKIIYLLFLGTFLSSVTAFGQVTITDDFADGDFTANPVWSGDVADFRVDNGQLQLFRDPEVADESHLVVESTASGTVEWSFKIMMDFGTSGSNLAKVYLMSDQQNLEGDLNGYYVLIGDSDDKISLYRQDGSSRDELISSQDTQDGIIDTDPVEVVIRVTKDLDGNWELFVDENTDGNFQSLGTATDDTYVESNFFGVFCDYTSTRSQLFFFDDIVINETQVATIPLTISNVEQSGNNAIIVTFNQAVNTSSAQNRQHYQLNKGGGSPNTATVVSGTDNQVRLSFGSLSNLNYTLTIDGVTSADESVQVDNATAAIKINRSFSFRDIVINEILADPEPGLQTAEYLELLNLTNRTIDLEGFQVDGFGSVLPSFELGAGAFVVLTASPGDFTVATVDVGSGALTNGGETLRLLDANDNLLDEVAYDDAWYTEDLVGNGISLEQINPQAACGGAINWTSSTAASGGTPGSQNAAFDNSEDQQAPGLLDFTIVSPDTLKLTFDELVPSDQFSAADFELNFSTTLSVVSAEDEFVDELLLALSAELTSERDYQLVIENLQDCEGNTSADIIQGFYFDNTPPELVTFLIKSRNQIDFIFSENLNTSSVQEEDFILNENIIAEDEDADSSRVSVFFESEFLDNTNYNIAINGIEDEFDNEIVEPISVEFQYRNDIDTLKVVAPNALDLVYSKTPTAASALNTSNYFLEDVGQPIQVRQLSAPNTYQLIFSENFPENRGIQLSIESIRDADGNTIVTPFTEVIFDTDDPDLESISVLDERSIELVFDEALEKNNAEILNHYLLNDTDNPVAAEAQNNVVRLVFGEPFPVEVEQELRYDELEDLFQNRMTRSRLIRFVYDTLPPSIDSVVLIAGNEVHIQFSETLNFTGDNRLNYSLSNGLTPVEAMRFPWDSSQVRLLFETQLPSTPSLSGEVSSIEDNFGNQLAAPLLFSINSQVPILAAVEFVSATRIHLQYSVPLSPTTLNSGLSLLENMSWVSASTDNHILEINLEQPLENGQEVNFSIPALTSQANVAGESFEGSAIFRSYFDHYKIIRDDILELHFTRVLGQFDLDSFGGELSIGTIIQDQDDPVILRLFLAEPIAQNSTNVLSWNGLRDVFGRIIPDFSIMVRQDSQPPQVTSILPGLTNDLTIRFDEPLDPITALAFNHYALADNANPIAEIKLLGDSTIRIQYEDNFIDNTDYELSISRIEDLSGNIISDTTLNFNYLAPYRPVSGDLIFTELMIDPTPAIELPEEEYIEIYNQSTEVINLFNVVLSDQSSSIVLGNAEIRPGEYLLLVDDNDLADFSGIENILALSSLPSLGNSSDSLALSVEGELIDFIAYNNNWYDDEQRDDGGYSLEWIGYATACGVELSWRASMSDSGGTPGAPNANFNFSDTTIPTVSEAVLVGNDTIQLVFSELIDPTSLNSSALQSDRLIQHFTMGDDQNVALVILQQALTAGDLMNLTVAGVSDCFGNAMEPADFEFGIGRSPGFNELIITEIMADPEPSAGLPNAEYLELFNATADLISLQNLTLADGTSSTTLPSVNIRGGERVILTTTGNASSLQLYGRAIGVSNWPSLNNGGELISIRDGNNLIFSVEYSDQWYKDSQKSEGGFSLEMIDPTNPCGEFNNWTASIDANGGTPGSINSVDQPNPDNFGPIMTQALATGANQVVIEFNEKLGLNSSSWQLAIEPTLQIQGAVLRNDLKGIIINTGEEIVQNTRYSLSVSGITDCNGNFIEANAEIEFVRPEAGEAGDLLLNEILFNPRSGGVDFIEVANTSKKFINLKNWIFSNSELEDDFEIITTDDLIIAPGGILAFTEDINTILDQYPQANRSNLILADIPTMSNDAGSVLLINPSGNIADRFDYEEDFHNPLINDVDGVSLERVSLTAPTQLADNWQSAAASANFATPGLPNSQSRENALATSAIDVNPKVFIPGSINAFTTISYAESSVGSFANVQIYDAQGQLVKTLAENQLLAAGGFFTWDGTNESGTKVKTGIYIIIFERYNNTGEAGVLRETVVVGANF